MEHTKTTPGPWQASRTDPGTFQVATVELFGIYSTHPEGGNEKCGNPEDDAALIAAAPDLLTEVAALKAQRDELLAGLQKHVDRTVEIAQELAQPRLPLATSLQVSVRLLAEAAKDSVDLFAKHSNKEASHG